MSKMRQLLCYGYIDELIQGHTLFCAEFFYLTSN